MKRHHGRLRITKCDSQPRTAFRMPTGSWWRTARCAMLASPHGTACTGRRPESCWKRNRTSPETPVQSTFKPERPAQCRLPAQRFSTTAIANFWSGGTAQQIRIPTQSGISSSVGSNRLIASCGRETIETGQAPSALITKIDRNNSRLACEAASTTRTINPA